MLYRDYSLTGKESISAQKSGLSDADWYQSPISKQDLKALLERKDGPAVRDTLLWFAILGLTGTTMWLTWGTMWFISSFLLYSIFYASVSDSRWHESSHGTAFKTDWMNNVLYEISSFMVFRESTTWRWSHTRHHTDTIIVGRDPEIASPRPANLFQTAISFFKITTIWAESKRIIKHAFGGRDDNANNFVPESEWKTIHFKARLYVAIYLAVIGLAIITQSLLPLMYVGLPTIFGSWLISIYGYTQHTGLAEDVTDHRLNCRTVYMNKLNRYLYWNMNYHLEHHMYPLVPYHALPKLHELIKDDCPTPYSSLFSAWKEIIPALVKQSKDALYFVKRELPKTTISRQAESHTYTPVHPPFESKPTDTWLKIGRCSLLHNEDVIRADFKDKTYAVYRTGNGKLYATTGICTHGNTHLADGFVTGNLIECPKHNGRFDITTGEATRAPACKSLTKYPAVEHNDNIYLNVTESNNLESTLITFTVVESKNISTLVREVTLKPNTVLPNFAYQPGDFIQLTIPKYTKINMADFDIYDHFKMNWQKMGILSLSASNPTQVKRNYSLATNPVKDKELKLNVRMAFKTGNDVSHPGIGSSYVYNLKAGDTVSSSTPQGSFRINDSDSEMLYLGGGAGMAPLRSHLSYLLETLNTTRKITFWYGARNRSEILYEDYFNQLSVKYPNFTYFVVLSEPEEHDCKSYPTGFVHQVMYDQYLSKREQPTRLEYYLCGPPPMMSATKQLLQTLKVPKDKIVFDEF